ncbi:universal stress protein [Streptomyces sp. NPDC097619]|uniref:universal stress protein n=1 Tax=Streptomyces sp. NPDC097619 TaxID=3157228 RepID=UPI00333297F1
MITEGAQEGPVVVAVDGSEHSLKALDWALTAATAAGAELVIAHVMPDHAQYWQARRTAVIGEPESEPEDPVAGWATGHLKDREAGDEGRGGPPSVRFVSLTGAVPAALDRQAEGARMLVLGSRGRGGFASLLLGSTSRACATKAPCPVVVVPHSARSATGPVDGAGSGSEGDAGGDTGRVVLGLNPSETADEVIGFAFRRAAERGLTLTAVTAFLDPVSPLPLIGTPMQGLPAQDVAPLLREIERAQQERLAPFRDGPYAAVPVESVVGPGDAAGQLVALSGTAELLVVGRHRPRLQADSLLMGSVANAALQHAGCAVAVVPGS